MGSGTVLANENHWSYNHFICTDKTKMKNPDCTAITTIRRQLIIGEAAAPWRKIHEQRTGV